ncbi:MAG: TIR domain-containing protein [Anaerolineales bacterium]|nr:TIR domain-containing protein [Anaerolineales bacterium]
MEESSRKTNIFISYSRKDKLFVRKLNDALDALGVDAWVDWEGIELASDWMARITAAIEGGDAFVFVISPDSLKSKVCLQELELGIASNKKIIPVLYREPEKRQKMHPKLASTNWVYLRTKKDDFKATIPKLVEAIQTDLGWVQQHTRLLQRASEWELKQRNRSYLLQGSDLEDGERWMTASTTGPNRSVNSIQAEYISTSRKVAIQRQRNLTIGVGAMLILSIFFGIFALRQRNLALASEQEALKKEQARAAQQAIAEEQKAIAEEQKVIAEQQTVIAEENAQKAKAQRSAAEAKIYQDRVGELDTSTLLAVNALQQLPGLEDAENILRHNITLLPIPINQVNLEARIWTIQTSPDQSKFVTSDSDGKACVFSMEDGTQLFCTQHDGIVYDTSFSEDGEILATGTEKGVLTFWNADTGEQIKSMKFEGTIWDLSPHPGGRWLGVGRSNAISMIDMTDMTEALFITQAGEVKTIDFDDSGSYMAIATSKGNVTIWAVMGNQSVSGPKHNGEIIDIEFSPDGNWVISVGQDSTARGAQSRAGGQKYSITHGDWVEDVTFGPDSSWFVTVSDDNTVRVIDTATGQERLRMAHANFVQKVRVSRDGQWIATTGYDKTLRIWDSASGTEVMQIPLDGIGSSIRFNRDSTRMIIGDNDGNVTLWDISQLKARKGILQFPEFVNEAHFSPDGKWLAVNSDDRNIWRVNLDESGNALDDRKVVHTTNGLTGDMVISPDSQWVAAVENDENVADYNRVVLVNAEGTTKFFLTHDKQVIDAVVFTPDSRQVITADQQGIINIWDVTNGEKVNTLVTDDVILSLAVSPNGKYLAAGVEENNYSIVWDLAAASQIATLPQIGRIKSVQFSNDGNLLATGSSETTIFLWNAADGSFNRMDGEYSVNGEALSMEFSPDDKQLAVGDSTGYVYLFDIGLNQEIARLPHADKVTSISFTPDGAQLATASRKTVPLWNVPSIPHIVRESLIESACARMTHNFNQSIWGLLFFDEEYRPICPNLADGN